MKKRIIRFYIGTEKDRDNSNLEPQKVKLALDRAEKYISKRTGGCTVYYGYGSWLNNKDLIKEKSAIVETLADDNLDTAKCATYMRRLFKQAAVMVTEQEQSVSFI